MAYGSTSSSAIARWGAGIAGAAAALIGAFWLAAWLMGIGARWSASGVLTVKTNMAVGLVLSGAALLLLATGGATSWHRRLGAAAAAVVLLIGAATLSEYLVGWDLGIDQLLATEPAGAVATASPNRIGLPGSTSLVLLGTGLLAAAWGRRSQVVTRYLGLAVCLIVLVPLVGFVYGVHEFYSATQLTGIAWPTTIAMLLLGIGLMLARPEAGPASLLLREDAGAVLLRRMLPAAVLVPLALGFVRVLGQHRGLYDTAMGTGLLVISLILIFSAMLWRSAAVLSRSEASQRQAEEQTRSLARFPEDNPNPILRVADDGRVLYANRPGLVLLQALGSDSGQLLPQPLLDAVRQVLDGKNSDPVECVFTDPRDRVWSFMLAGSPRDRHINFYGRDITERKRAENLSQAMNRIGELIHSSLDFEQVMRGVLSEASRALEAETAAASLREADGWVIRHVCGLPESAVGVRMNDEQEPHAVLAIQAKEAVAIDDAFQDERVNREHMRRWNIRSALVVPLVTEDQVIGVLFFNYHKGTFPFQQAHIEFGNRLASSISLAIQNTHLVQRLQESNATLEKRVAERTAVAETRAEQLRMLAHELTQAEQRERQRISHVLHEHFQQLLVGAQFSLSIVRSNDAASGEALRQAGQILSEAVEASRSLAVELSPPMLRYGGLAPALGWLGQWMREKHGLKVEVVAEPHVPMPAEDVQVLLFQAVRELLFNVVKHAKVDQARVELKQEPDRLLRLSVSDKGAGFHADTLVARASIPGGFGLFSIRERLSFLEGRMEIKSAPGGGTCISLLVPLPPATQAGAPPGATVKSPATASAEKQDSAADPPTVSAAKIRVLVADDHAVVRDGLSRLLQTLPDMEAVGKAKDGQEVVELALQLRPDVVIMDVSMPERSGIEATRCILADLPGIRIIGLSMFMDQDVADQMRQAGAVDYLAKSTPTDGLIAAIRASVRKT